MFGIGIIEMLLILVLAVTFIIVYVLIAKRLVNCRIEPNQKVFWIVMMLLFDILGAVIFFIYHDFILDPQLRAK